MGMNVKFAGAPSVTQIGSFTANSQTGTTYTLPALYTTFQATGANNGGTFTSATIVVEVSNDETQWVTMGTISLSGDGDTDGFAANANWRYVRAKTTAFSESGSTPTVTVTMGG